MSIKRSIFLLLVLLSAGFNSFAQNGARGLEVLASKDTAVQKHTWGVIIGISDYQHIPKLKYADQDALAVYDYLKNKKGIDGSHLQLLVNENAISSNIYTALYWLGESAKKNDRVIIYFAGHGDVESKIGQGFLLGTDVNKVCYSAIGGVSVYALNSYIDSYLLSNQAKDILLIVDACRAGTLAGGDEGLETTMRMLNLQGHSNKIIRILSAQENELSYEDTKWGGGRGVFSYYLIKGLEGQARQRADSVITALDLSLYLPAIVSQSTDGKQNPIINGDRTEKLFSFNKALLNSAQQDEAAADQQKTWASRGWGDKLDPEIKQWFERYTGAIRASHLLPDGNEGEDKSANFYYLKLMADPRAKSLIPTLKSSFVIALRRKTDIILDDYVQDKEFFVYSEKAYNEIKYAITLMDTANILYNNFRARLLFLESGKTRNNNESINLLEKLIRIEPDASYAYNELGRKFAQDPDQIDSAAFYLNKAIALSPTWATSYADLALFNTLNKDFKAAAENLYKASRLDTTRISYLYNLAINLRYSGENEKANIVDDKSLRLAQRLVRNANYTTIYSHPRIPILNPGKSFSVMYITANIKNNYTSYHLIGLAYFKNGEYRMALENFKKAQELYPKNALILNEIGNCYAELGNNDLSEENYRKAITLDPKLNDSYENLEDFYDKQKDYKNFLKYALEAIKMNPEMSINYYNAACAYSLLKKREEAFENLKEALQKGFRDYQHISTDMDLRHIRHSNEFKQLLQQYFPGIQ